MDSKPMAPYPLTNQMSAFVEKTLGFSSADSSLTGLRQAYSEMCQAFTPPRPAGLEVTDFTLSGVEVRSYRPPVTPPTSGWPCMLYLHGGGWVVGDLDSHDFICAELAATLGAMVVAVDYRLAPEHPFPAGFEDCLKVWRALRSGPFWFDPERMIVAGDSAGANLAAALGFLQYLAPTLVLLQAVLLFGEHLSSSTLVAFIFIWAGLAIYSVDAVISMR